MRRIPSLMLWILFGLAIVAVPIACSSSSTNGDGGDRPSRRDDQDVGRVRGYGRINFVSIETMRSSS